MAIPSTTKLVLLYTLIQTIPEVIPKPLVHLQSQEGGSFNVRADLKDIGIILLPSKEAVMGGISFFLGKQAGGGRSAMDLIKSNFGFLKPEKSPYRVDLEKSRVKLHKVDSSLPVAHTGVDHKEVEKTQGEKMGSSTEFMPSVHDHSTEEPEKAEPVKSEILKEKNNGKKKEDESKKKHEPSKVTKGMKMEENEPTLLLIQEGIEECGPDGHRNEEGICIFTPLT